MTAVQADLFRHDPALAPAATPTGFDYWADVLTVPEQAELVAQLQGLSFRPCEHMGYVGFRRIAAFGRRHDADRRQGATADPWPDFLQILLGVWRRGLVSTARLSFRRSLMSTPLELASAGTVTGRFMARYWASRFWLPASWVCV